MEVQIKYPKTKCAYCGRPFTKHHNRQTYCSDECRDNARREKKRTYNSRYYYKNKKRILNTAIGTTTMSPHKHPEHKREAEIVQNEVQRIGLHTSSLNVLN